MAPQTHVPFRPKAFLASPGNGKKFRTYRKNEVVFLQGAPADSVCYIREGRVKLTVSSAAGKEAVTGLPGPGEFFGEGCLSAQTHRKGTARAIEDSLIVKVEKVLMADVLASQPEFSALFMSFLLARNQRVEADLVDQIFNSAEKRLARTLLLLANDGGDADRETIKPRVSQELLAEMIGTTRSRVSYFMNHFRKLGYIHYNGGGSGLKIRSSLLKVVLHD
jgi:CRP-like cAMP-binding protein